MKWMTWLGLVGLAIFLFIVSSVGPGQIIASLLSVNLFFFSLALLTLVSSVMIQGLKQGLLVNGFGARLGFFESIRIWLIGFFFSIISPGRTGSVVKGFYFAEKGQMSVGKGVAAVVAERFFDVATLLLFAILGFAGLSLYLLFEFDFAILFLVAIAFFSLVFLFSKRRFVLFFLRPFHRFLVPERFKPLARKGFHQFFEAVDFYKANRLLMAKVAFLAVLVWVFAIAGYYLMTLALGVEVSFLYLFAVMPIVDLLSALPIAFSGLGTREASLVFFLGLVGITPNAAVSLSLLILLVNFALAIPGFLFFLRGRRPSFRLQGLSKTTE